MVSIKDIARESGYSIATVSRVLNNKRNVDPEIAEKVLRCAREMNYVPNAIGQILRSQKSNLILCIIPNIYFTMVSESFYYMQQRFAKEGYHLLLHPVDPENNHAPEIISALNSNLIAGLISVAPLFSPEDIDKVNQKCPFIQLAEYVDEPRTATVSIDYPEVSRGFVNHLVGLGHKRIAVLKTLPESPSNIRKSVGYTLALAENGIPFDQDLVKNVFLGDPDPITGVLNELLQLEDPPTAFTCDTDLIAAQCIQALTHMGYSVPKDFSVTGFGNSLQAVYNTPGIASAGVSREDMGIVTAEMLLRQIKTGEKNNEKVLLPHTFCFRDSTGPAPVR